MSKLEARSEVSGFVWKIETAPGQRVAKGDTLVLIESMKMEIPVRACGTWNTESLFGRSR